MTHSRLALVTGSTAGIGFAIAKKLAQKNFHVIINGRTEERVNKAIQLLTEHDLPRSRFHGVAADLSTVEGAQRIQELHPNVEVLVNNFGIFEPKKFEDITDADWNLMWNSNFLSGARLSRHYFPGMLKRNHGRILFISSESALQIPVEMIHYGVSKTAQVALARGMAEAAIGTGVTVNSVLVGPTKSEGVETFIKQLGAAQKQTEAQVEKDFFKSARPTSLLQRFIQPDEVGSFVAFLASDEASAITGSALRVDGGVVKSIV